MSTTPAGTQPAAPATDPQPTTGDPPASAETTPAAPGAPAAAPAPPATPEPATGDEPLGEAGKKALDAERSARQKAEREAAAEKKRADDLAAEKLSDEDKLKKRAEDGDTRFREGTDKARRANLIIALQEKGLVGGKAKAAAKLISVEYTDDDEPKELDAAITAAKAEYGEELFQVGATPPAPPDPNATTDGNGTTPATPNLHQGAQTPAADQEEATAIQALTDGLMASPANSPLSIVEE